jgi:hypothetical protein
VKVIVTHHTAISTGQNNTPCKINLKPNIFTNTRVNDGFLDESTSSFQSFSSWSPSGLDSWFHNWFNILNFFFSLSASSVINYQRNTTFLTRKSNYLALTNTENLTRNLLCLVDGSALANPFHEKIVSNCEVLSLSRTEFLVTSVLWFNIFIKSCDALVRILSYLPNNFNCLI